MQCYKIIKVSGVPQAFMVNIAIVLSLRCSMLGICLPL